ncbi:MAG: hypothetical protein LBU62_00515, partial [Bacteroidales bacterium]|nr:hypothetical protein [Bacteroidales bacterium]
MMKQNVFEIYTIILIRWKQIYRAIVQLGALRLVFLLALCLLVLITINILSKQIQYSALLTIVWTFLILSIHKKRSDKIFLQVNMNYDKLIFSIEYFLLSIPFIICLALRQQWVLILFLALFCFGTGFFVNVNRKKQKTLNTRLQQYIPFRMYEWKAGMRQYFFILVVVWSLGLGTAFFVASIPVAIFIMGMVICDFYKTDESWQMLLSYQKKTANLLLYKIKQHILLYFIFNLPLIISFLIFHVELWYIIVVEFVILLSIHLYCIVLKYALYSLNQASILKEIFVILGIFIGLFPFSTPVLWLFSIFLFLKAQTNLYPYLNDYC